MGSGASECVRRKGEAGGVASVALNAARSAVTWACRYAFVAPRYHARGHPLTHTRPGCGLAGILDPRDLQTMVSAMKRMYHTKNETAAWNPPIPVPRYFPSTTTT